MPKDHLCYKRGCLICSGHHHNRDTFIEASNKIHGTGTYDYSQVVFLGVKIPVKIICKTHGPFMQTPDKHKNSKQGCPKCGGYERKNLEYVIKKGNEIHNNKYDYSRAIFTFMSESIEIICPTHCSFWQTPVNHIVHKQGCPKCAIEASRSTQQQVIEKFIQTHGDRYDYSKVKFTIFANKVEIVCRNHGSFWALPQPHI